jgi:hypothetical protein
MSYLEAGISKTSDIVARARTEYDLGISPGYVDGIRATWRKEQKGTVLMRDEPATKKERILTLYREGVMEPAKIHELLKTRYAMDATLNHIYKVLHQIRDAEGGGARKGRGRRPAAVNSPPMSDAKVEAKEVVKAPTVAPQRGVDVDPELVRQIEALSLVHGFRNVDKAVSYVKARVEKVMKIAI